MSAIAMATAPMTIQRVRLLPDRAAGTAAGAGFGGTAGFGAMTGGGGAAGFGAVAAAGGGGTGTGGAGAGVKTKVSSLAWAAVKEADGGGAAARRGTDSSPG